VSGGRTKAYFNGPCGPASLKPDSYHPTGYLNTEVHTTSEILWYVNTLTIGKSDRIIVYKEDLRRWQPSRKHRRLISYKQTDVSEVRTASIFRAIIARLTKRRSNSNMFYAVYKLTPKVGIHEVKIYRRTCFNCYATRTFPNLFGIIHSSLSVAWLGLLVAGLSLRRPAFVSGSVHMGFLVYKVALGQVFTRILWFPLSVSFHRGSPYSYII
jgi:hypothetical protein